MHGKTLGLIGSGMIGATLARLAVAAGINVVLSNSRGPHTLVDKVAKLGDRARAATPEEAAASSDLVVATIPLAAYRSLPAADLAGKTVIDTMNYYEVRDGRMAELDAQITSSALVQQHLAASRVVKAFNNILYTSLFKLPRPLGAPDRSALPIAGDDDDAKEEAAVLLDLLGYDAVDAGALDDSWRFEPGTPAYSRPYSGGEHLQTMNIQEFRQWSMNVPATPVSAAAMKDLLNAAVRTA